MNSVNKYACEILQTWLGDKKKNQCVRAFSAENKSVICHNGISQTQLSPYGALLARSRKRQRAEGETITAEGQECGKCRNFFDRSICRLLSTHLTIKNKSGVF